MIIDVHTHFVPRAYLDYVRENGAAIGRQIVTHASGAIGIRDHEREFPLTPAFYDEDVQLAEMARRGVDCQTVSVPPFMFHYELPGERAEELSRLYNDEALKLHARHPGRFIVAATLPLQDPAGAVSELERVAGLGIRAVEIGASIHRRELDDPALEPFWSAAERLGTVVLVHPTRPPGRERMTDYHLFNLIGFLSETTLAAARLIFSGLLDRHRRLKICLAHAGGMLLWIKGRFDHAYATIAACSRMERKPSDYLSAFYYDSLTYEPRALAYALGIVGADRIMLGSDYPFAIGDADPVGSVAATAGLSARDRAAILGGTAAALFDARTQ